MHVDTFYGSLSDKMMVVAIVTYTLAMMGYGIEYAFGRRGVVARVAARTAPPAVQVLVGAGGPEVTVPAGPEPPAGTVPPGTPPVSADGAAVAGRVAVGLTVLGALAHLACLVCRGIAADRVPWGNMYEYVLLASLVATVGWLVTVFRTPTVRHLGTFVSLVVVVLMGLAGFKLYATAGPLVPALHSYWLVIHVSAMATASGVFAFGFVAGGLYLIRERYEARVAAAEAADEEPVLRFPLTLAPRLPKAASLERLAFRVHAFAFPIWTFGVMCGAIWAEHAWGRYWGWDPKETWSFISWVVYAAYLHARATPSVRGRWATWIAMLGWATMMVNLFFINFVVSGLHSYAGVG
jgi:cytochrome c-type biogenesis protein CcsB